ESALGQSDHLRANPNSPFVERLDGDLVSLTDLAKHVLFLYHAVFHYQLACRAGADTELVLFLAHGKAGEIFLNQEGGNSAIALVGSHVGKNDEQARFVAIR